MSTPILSYRLGLNNMLTIWLPILWNIDLRVEGAIFPYYDIVCKRRLLYLLSGVRLHYIKTDIVQALGYRRVGSRRKGYTHSIEYQMDTTSRRKIRAMNIH